MDNERNVFGIFISWLVTVIVDGIFIYGFVMGVGGSLTRYEILGASLGEIFMSNLANIQEFNLIPVLFLIALVIGVISLFIFKKIGYLNEKLFKISVISLTIIFVLAIILLASGLISLEEYKAVSGGVTQYNVRII